MDERQHERRVPLTARINVRESAYDALRVMARDERVPIPTMIGIAVEAYVTTRSTS